MATINVINAPMAVNGATGLLMPFPSTGGLLSVVATSTGSSAEVAGIAAPATQSVWMLSAEGGDVLAAFGSAPNTSTNAIVVKDGAPVMCFTAVPGDKVAIKTA